MIGLFGGTFDPIHLGHLRPALEVAEALGLEQVRFSPARRPPHRGLPSVSAAHRAEMVRLAVENEPRFALETCELEREGPSYTFETLVALRARYGAKTPLVLIIGTDAFAALTTWRHWERLIDLAHIAVMLRPGSVVDASRYPAGWLDAVLREDYGAVRERAAGFVVRVPVTQLAISATDIRQRIAAGLSAKYLVSEPVLQYIAHHQLFQQPTR